MAHPLAQRIPNVDDLLALEPEELAQPLLEVLKAADQQGLNLHNFCLALFQFHEETYPRQRGREVLEAVTEAWMWLHNEGLLAPRPGGMVGSGWVYVTRRGRRIQAATDFEAYLRARAIPKALIHERIREKTWSMLLRGDYDTAVFQAFKEVEVAVRDACGWSADVDHIDVRLMRRAFVPAKGPLVDGDAEQGEQQALCELFAGAIGSYKNPQSHRHVGVPTAEEAAEMIILASHLLRIVEARAAALAGH